MLLTITYRSENATDLGFLLFKNPKRPQAFALSYGKVYVFYPEASEDVCTAALLLDIDPIDLARGKVGSKDGGLFDYVNDRPYVSSSFMSTAISRVFGTAMTGRCDKKPDLVQKELDLTVTVTTLPCKGDTGMLNRVFEPLGYSVSFDTAVLDEKYPQWGDGKYVNLTISGKVRLQALLRHLYVLIPVFDRKKHYWIGRDEVDKLLRNGEGWLEEHPEKIFITDRYMGGRRSLTRLAMEGLQLDRMDDGQAGAVTQDEPSNETEAAPKSPSLNTRRLTTVVQALKDAGATSVIDMGCGEGNLLSLLLEDRSFSRIAGMDVSWQALERASQHLKLERLPDVQKNRITLFQSSLTYKDERFCGYDAACVVEVIEHLDENRLSAFEQVLFGETKPVAVVLTTPNLEYNENYAFLHEGNLRHGDHRFEWTRDEFSSWAHTVAKRYGYTVTISQIGDEDETRGTPTQMGVFTLCE
jgi:3' terminal RNA ribose 2'-O-methyltransferase Hen1